MNRATDGTRLADSRCNYLNPLELLPHDCVNGFVVHQNTVHGVGKKQALKAVAVTKAALEKMVIV